MVSINMALMSGMLIMRSSRSPTSPRAVVVVVLEGGKGGAVRSNRQEDDSGVNHLWKGEMWPARVGLIRARHEQNTRGAGANNCSSCQ